MNNNERLTIFPSDKKIKILFLPGWNTKKEIYEELIRSFKKYGEVAYYAFEGFETKLHYPYTYKDYEYNLINSLKENDFIPDIIVGYSFGGKVALKSVSLFNNVKLLLIAPSSFDHNFLYKLKVKLKIFIYKVSKKLNIRFSFLESSDYKNSDYFMRKTLINVKDVFVSKNELKQINNQIIIVGYKEDKSVSCYDLKNNSKYLKNKELYIFNGTHYQLFKDKETIELLLERLIKHDSSYWNINC